MNVLVTGGAGYVGCHAVRRLLREGHEVTVLDDLSRGRRESVAAAAAGTGREAFFAREGTGNRAAVARLLKERRVDAVMHFAAFIEVGESVADPSRYYRNNFSAALSLLDAMRDAGVGRLVFSSTAAVYGSPVRVPIAEDHPRSPINPYGRSKLMTELALEDCSRAYGLGYVALRYFNVAGASPEGGIGESHEPESHLIPRVLAAAAGRAESVELYGTDYPTPDGTCIRDYVHVEDLVEAHLLALGAVRPGRGTAYNLGSEKGFSVRQVIDACSRVTGARIPVIEKARRPGDPAELVADSARIREELGWRRRYPDLESIAEHAWRWELARAAG